MKCENLQFNLPVYMDDFLTEDERAPVEEHLARCPVCRQKLADFQALRNDLRGLSRPEIPNQLVAAMRNRVAQEITTAERKPFFIFGEETFAEWLRPRLLPYSLGTALSVVLSITLLWSLLSAAHFRRDIELAKYQPPSTSRIMLANSNSYPAINSNSYPAANDFEITPAEFAALRLSVSDKSPSINPRGALIALTKSFVRGEMKDDEVVVVADVFGSGLAQIAEVVEPSSDKRAVRELEKALRSDPNFAPPFVPANLDHRSDKVRVVLKIQHVNVHIY